MAKADQEADQDPVLAAFEMDRAREAIRARLAAHPDAGVRAINALCDPPEDAVRRAAIAFRNRDGNA